MHNFFLLARIHHGLWRTKERLPFGFDLDEHQGRSIPSHDIDFAPATTVVLVLNTVALALQKLHGHLFAMLTAPAAPTTHPPLPSRGRLRGEPRGSSHGEWHKDRVS